MQNNEIGDEGVVHIARALSELTRITEMRLDFGKNAVKDYGACELA